jgi:hypothetical protein
MKPNVAQEVLFSRIIHGGFTGVTGVAPGCL